MKVTIANPALFLAAARVASTEQTRYYLRGVYVQRAEGGGLLYTATDGHRLIHAHDPRGEMEGCDSVIIGIEKPKFAAKWWKANEIIWQDNLLKSDNGEALITGAVDGTFPDYTRVIPGDTSGEIAQFDWAYVNDFAQIAKLGGFGQVVLNHNGDGASIVTFARGDLFGVLMPMRKKSYTTIKPTLPKAIA